MRQLLKFSLLVSLLLIQVLPAFSQSKKFRTDSLRVDNGMLFGTTNVTPLLSNFDGSFLNSSVINFANGDRLGFVNKYSDDLAATVSALSSGGLIVVIDTVDVTTNVTLSDDMRIAFWSKGILNITSGDTINIPRNAIDAKPDQHIFMGSGEVRTPGSHVHSAWFGAVGDGVTDDTDAVQWGADALRYEGDAYTQGGTAGIYELGAGTYELNPANRMFFVPDSGKMLWLKGQGDQTRIHNTDFPAYGDLIGDHYVVGSPKPGGTLRISDSWFTGTHRGDADGTGGANTISASISNLEIYRVRIDSSGNRAIACEGYTAPSPGWKNVTIRDVEINYSWKNAMSFNKHDDGDARQITIENAVIDGYSQITIDSSTSQVAIAVQVLYNGASTNPGLSFSLNNFTIKNGYSTGLSFNGALNTNDVRVSNGLIYGNDLQYTSGGAALLNTAIVYGSFNNLKILKNTGGPGVRDRTGNAKQWTNCIVDSNGTYGFDINAPLTAISNSRIADNGQAQFYLAGGSNLPNISLSNCFVRGDTLVYDGTNLVNPRFGYIQSANTIWEKIELSPSAGYNIVQNGYFARDSINTIIDLNNDGMPDGWALDVSEAIMDSFYVALNDSGLVLWNRATTSGDVVFRQYIADRAEGGATYDFEVYVYAQNAINCRLYNNATDLGSINPAGAYSYTGKTVTGYVQFGRQGATEWNPNTRVVIKWIRVLKE